jgi:hypothetical protein
MDAAALSSLLIGGRVETEWAVPALVPAAPAAAPAAAGRASGRKRSRWEKRWFPAQIVDVASLSMVRVHVPTRRVMTGRGRAVSARLYVMQFTAIVRLEYDGDYRGDDGTHKLVFNPDGSGWFESFQGSNTLEGDLRVPAGLVQALVSGFQAALVM